MKALQVIQASQFELGELPVPTPGPGEVLLRVAYCGICGSDLPRYFNGATFHPKQVLGHEFSGVVAALGPEVTSVAVGARVAAVPFVPLNDPQAWAEGNPSCSTAIPRTDNTFAFIGTKRPGGMAEYAVVPAANCVPVPDDVALHQAAMIEPLAVCIHAVDRVAFPAGATVMVLGTGTIGLLTIGVLKARGAGHIIAVDLNPNKLAIAAAVGADICLDPAETPLADYFATHEFPKYIYEAAGNAVTQKEAIDFVGRRGQIVFIGISTKDLPLDAYAVESFMRREATLTASWNSYSTPFPGYEWHAALRYIQTGQIDTTQFITGFYRLADMAKPFEEMVTPNSAKVKLMYQISGED